MLQPSFQCPLLLLFQQPLLMPLFLWWCLIPLFQWMLLRSLFQKPHLRLSFQWLHLRLSFQWPHLMSLLTRYGHKTEIANAGSSCALCPVDHNNAQAIFGGSKRMCKSNNPATYYCYVIRLIHLDSTRRKICNICCLVQ